MLTKKQKDKIKLRLASKDGCLCCYCCKIFSLSELTIDHLVPKSRGGSDDFKNLALACQPCNSARGNTFLLYSGGVR